MVAYTINPLNECYCLLQPMLIADKLIILTDSLKAGDIHVWFNCLLHLMFRSRALPRIA